jgi:hypothetical protein
MLIEFRVENHRSLRNEQVLTMETGRAGTDSAARPRDVAGYSLLPVAALYGANASGKTNVLAALAFMRDSVVASHRSWAPDEGVPRDPFAWGSIRTEPSCFETTLLVDDVRYQYGFVASDQAFLEEWLYAWPLGKRQVWFERDGAAFRFGDNLKGENKLIEEVTRPNALFLSAAAQHRHEQLTPIYSWFRAIEGIRLPGRVFARAWQVHTEIVVSRLLDQDIDPIQRPLFEEDASVEPMLGSFRNLLKTADIGIVDLKLERGEANESHRRSTRRRFLLRHSSEFPDAWLPLDEESHGTQTLFRMAVPMLQVLQTGGILLVDELEASLHPAVAQQIVQRFNDPLINSHNAQLIFTTHDTNLLGTTLGEPVLRRDQVWLTEKDGQGVTVLYPLTDFKPRRAENLERGYLQGRYGAIPFLADFIVAAD